MTDRREFEYTIPARRVRIVCSGGECSDACPELSYDSRWRKPPLCKIFGRLPFRDSDELIGRHSFCREIEKESQRDE